MDIDASGLLMMVVCFVGCSVPSRGRSVKRIADGEELRSQGDFSTHHFVHLRDSYGCIINQATHELGGCLEENICGGTLIHPEFVITAQHCVSYWEFILKSFGEIYNVSIKDIPGLSLEELGFFNQVQHEARIIPNKAQSKHAFYSNVALVAGSANFFHMTQKRHAYKVFSHPTYYHRIRFSLLEHDVAIVQACAPFQITENVKTPKVKPMNLLLTQWSTLIKRSASCLFIGFGITDDYSTGVYHNINQDHRLNTEYVRYTWRQISCPEKCRVEYNAEEAHANPCIGCSEHIPPRFGTALKGDSGGPVVCDGWYIGLFIAGWYEPPKNSTQNWIYPLHCITKAFTPEAFEYYRNAPAGKGRFIPLYLDIALPDEEQGNPL